MSEALLDASPEVVLLVDTEGRILFANRAFRERFGVSTEQAVGSQATDVLPEGVAAQRATAMRRAVESGTPVVLDDERDGRHFETQFRPMPDGSGVIRRIAVFTRETTDVRAAQRALAESEARLKVVTQKLPIPIWVSRLDDGRILVANEGLHSLLGLPQGSLIGELTPNLYEQAEDRAAFLSELQREGRVRQREVPIRLPDGTRRIIWASAELAEVAGEPVMMGCFLDVTERREAEARLQEMGKMDAVGRLAGGIAHDFNNLLTAIDGYTGLVRSTLAEDDSRLRDLDEIRGASKRAASLTRQLVAYSRRQALQPAAVDLNAAVDEMTGLLGRVIGDNVDLVSRLGRNLDSAWVDPTQLQQVLMNLVLNARDAMPNGGTISVTTAALAAGDTSAPVRLRDEGCLLLAVTDTGTGMDEETRSHVFEPFFTTKSVGQGTGLGLATVHGIVQQSGGEIEVSSVVGEGSTFRVFLRRTSRARTKSTDAFPAQRPNTVRRTVLVAEDEPQVRTLVTRMLESSGYQVLSAETGERALELAGSHSGPIDLLVTDVVMPGIDGPTLAGRIATARPETRVLFISGYSDVLRTEHANPPLLQKPFDSGRLESAVQHALSVEAAPDSGD